MAKQLKKTGTDGAKTAVSAAPKARRTKEKRIKGTCPLNLVNGSRIVKTRRKKIEMDSLRQSLVGIAGKDGPWTVRGIYYQAVSPGLVPKTKGGYRTVGKQLVKLRESGRVSWRSIVDATRWIRCPVMYDGIHQMLFDCAQHFRRNLMREQNCYIEVWCEKTAIANLLYTETQAYGVPLLPVSGFSSVSFLHESAMNLKHQTKPIFLFYIGDSDPSGKDIPRDIEAKLKRYSGRTDISFERLAVLPWQIKEWGLPTRPPKKHDSRSKRYKGPAVECDAIPPSKLRGLVRSAIERHIDSSKLERLRRIEEIEREQISDIARQWPKHNNGTANTITDSTYDDDSAHSKSVVARAEELLRKNRAKRTN